MSDRAKIANLDCGDAFLGSKYFPPDLITATLAHDPKGLLAGTSPLPGPPLSTAEQARLRPILDSRVGGKRLLVCSGSQDKLVPCANSRSVVALLRDAVDGWYAEGGVTVDDRVYEGVGHSFCAEMVEDAVGFLVDAVAEGPRKREGRPKM